ncbi:MAG: twin-arginine translocase subunit TatC, partial [Nitrososphaerota archaeon]|nr:twin-arginine translocase subunit TatC [Nitrososphaerota archaeon]
EHLSELAIRLKRSLYAFIIAFGLISALPNPFQPFGGKAALFGYNFLVVDLLDRAEITYAKGYQVFAPSVTTPISVFLNLSLVLALVISLPFVFNQIYGFIAPGLYQREKRAVRKYIVPFSLLFTVGGLFGLLVIFPIVMRILLDFYHPFGLADLISLGDFVNLLLLIPFVTGLAFTFPVYILPLVELNVLSAEQLSKSRKWVYAGVALGVSIANPDPTDISSLPIVIPILILFEITVFVAKRIEKNKLKKARLAGADKVEQE